MFPPRGDEPIREETVAVLGRTVPAFSIEGTPALATMYAIVSLLPRRPDLVVSGINFGENLGTDVTMSGTVGAAIEGADLGAKALAVSLQAQRELHYLDSVELDFTASQHFTHLFAQKLLTANLPADVDILKVDVPASATAKTPWRVTRQSRHRYHVPFVRPKEPGQRWPALDYSAISSLEGIEEDSDIRAVRAEQAVAVVPMSLDMTARSGLSGVERLLRQEEDEHEV
jgi:5'-nucleotidase